MIHSKDELLSMIHSYGILPFFTNVVQGWSVEEHIDPAVWFTSQEGPWEWKGQLASYKLCVYGKFIHNKAAFVSPEWFPDLANYRRDGYDWEGWMDDGKAPYKDRLLMEYLVSHPYVQSRYAKRECGFSKGYDTVITRLQMQTYVVMADFQYTATSVPSRKVKTISFPTVTQSAMPYHSSRVKSSTLPLCFFSGLRYASFSTEMKMITN